MLEAAGRGLKLQPATKTDHCGEVNVRETKMWADCVTMDDIVEELQDLFKEHPVLNHTGAVKDARYQLELQYSMGDDPAAGPSSSLPCLISSASASRLAKRQCTCCSSIMLSVRKGTDYRR